MAGQLFVDILFTQVARALGLQGRYEEGLAVLDDLGESADDELSVREQLERGRILNSSGKPDAARPLFEAAFDAANVAGLEHLAVDALHMIAIVAGADEQLALHEQALDLASTASDPRARQWRASLLNNLGWTRFERDEFRAALAAFEEALDERVKQGKAREIGVARWCVGRTLRALGRLDEALSVQVETAQEIAAAGITDPFVEEEIGECLRSLGREDEATPHFEAAAALRAADGAELSPT